MADREKVAAGLKACTEWGATEDECMKAGCPYLVDATVEDDTGWLHCIDRLHRDVMELLGWEALSEDAK